MTPETAFDSISSSLEKRISCTPSLTEMYMLVYPDSGVITTAGLIMNPIWDQIENEFYEKV